MKIIYANNFLSRLIGNGGKKNINHILIIPRCNAVHTFFMRENIDIIMTNQQKEVKYIFSNVKPFRVIMPKKDIYYTYEMPPNTRNFNIGDIMPF